LPFYCPDWCVLIPPALMEEAINIIMPAIIATYTPYPIWIAAASRDASCLPRAPPREACSAI
jgi:hypothetical protein